MDMTLKVRLAAMMILMLIAVMALQYILTQREQAELRRQIRLTVVHELARFFWLDKARIERRGYGAD